LSNKNIDILKIVLDTLKIEYKVVDELNLKIKRYDKFEDINNNDIGKICLPYDIKDKFKGIIDNNEECVLFSRMIDSDECNKILLLNNNFDMDFRQTYYAPL